MYSFSLQSAEKEREREREREREKEKERNIFVIRYNDIPMYECTDTRGIEME